MKLSIITINYNDKDGLAKTLDSVWNQQQVFDDFEHIVIDGGSTDGSVGVIEQYAGQLSYWVSEPDKGIYNAMNKGIAQAKGEYLLFLNGGDWLAPGILSSLPFDTFVEDIVYGDFIYVKENGSKIYVRYADRLTDLFLLIYSIGHPASFIRRSLFRDGGYDESFRVVSDWAFFCEQIIKNRCSVRHIRYDISYFNMYGISARKDMQSIIKEEHHRFLAEANIPVTPMLHDNIIEKIETLEHTFSYLTKSKTDAFLASKRMQYYTRKFIKIMFIIKKIFKQ